jgi:hypothetical protein
MEDIHKLDLYGIYDCNGEKRDFQGNITIYPEGIFCGTLNKSNLTKNAEKIVKGYLVREGNLAKLTFLEFDSNQSFSSDVLYQLESSINDNSILFERRDYNGKIKKLDKKINYCADYNMFINSLNKLVIEEDKANVMLFP